MSGYIGPLPVPQGIQRKQSFTATAGQTTFNTNGYTDGNFITVYLNGVRLINGTDYTATNGSDVVLTTAAAASDVLDFETFQTFSLVDQTFDNVTLKNPTHEDTDGGRESAVSFKGEQSGGEISTLAQIQASHDGTSDDQKGDLIFKTNDGSDNDAPTEAARIDSDRNFLVGKAVTTQNTAGTQISPTSGVRATVDGNVAAILNRTTSDGSIVSFRKDGTEVGSIQTEVSDSTTPANLVIQGGTANSSRLWLKGGDSGIVLEGHTNSILPTDEAGYQDNRSDLGSSNYAFRDIYLGGGAYIGGTTSSNYLEDYEEGTWTPTADQGCTGFTVQTAHYVKIGRSVTLEVYLTGFTGTNSSQLRIGGMPFAPLTSHYSTGVIDGSETGHCGFVRTNSTSTFLVCFYVQETDSERLSYLGNQTGTHLIFSITYQTSA